MSGHKPKSSVKWQIGMATAYIICTFVGVFALDSFIGDRPLTFSTACGGFGHQDTCRQISDVGGMINGMFVYAYLLLLATSVLELPRISIALVFVALVALAFAPFTGFGTPVYGTLEPITLTEKLSEAGRVTLLVILNALPVIAAYLMAAKRLSVFLLFLAALVALFNVLPIVVTEHGMTGLFLVLLPAALIRALRRLVLQIRGTYHNTSLTSV